MSSLASSFSCPPLISGEGGVDLVGECEFFLHDLVGEEKGEERSVLLGKRGNGEGRGRWWWWGTSGADEDTWHNFSVQATRRHGPIVDRPR